MIAYLQNEPLYKEQYAQVLPYAAWVERYREKLGLPDKTDAGIDLVAITHTGEFHAVQCKNFSAQHSVQKSDIDSFFTASGKTHFSYRLIITTTDKWSKHAENALTDSSRPLPKSRCTIWKTA